MKPNLDAQSTGSDPAPLIPPKAKPPTGHPLLQRMQLSSRELETLRYLSNGLTSNDIAVLLNLSTETVDTHRKNILRKLNANNIAQAVAYGLRYKMIE